MPVAVADKLVVEPKQIFVFDAETVRLKSEPTFIVAIPEPVHPDPPSVTFKT